MVKLSAFRTNTATVSVSSSRRPGPSSSAQCLSVSIRDTSVTSPGQSAKRDLQASCSAPKTHHILTSLPSGSAGSMPSVRVRSIRPTCETRRTSCYILCTKDMVVAVMRITVTNKTDRNRVPLFLGSTQELSWHWMQSSGLVPQDAVNGTF